MSAKQSEYISCNNGGTDLVIQLVHDRSPNIDLGVLRQQRWKVKSWGDRGESQTVLIHDNDGAAWGLHANGGYRLRPGRRANPPVYFRGMYFAISSVEVIDNTLVINRSPLRRAKTYGARTPLVRYEEPVIVESSPPTIQEFRDAITKVNAFKQSMGHDLVLGVDDGFLTATMEIK